MMTKQELDEINARCEAATDGPWHHHEEGIDGFIYSGPGKFDWRGSKIIVGGEAHEGYIGKNEPNTIFIRHARIDIPTLLAEVERLRQLVTCDHCGKEGHAICSVCDNDD